jgi:uncharacterized lipoprotein NlpE involved in copper resistance
MKQQGGRIMRGAFLLAAFTLAGCDQIAEKQMDDINSKVVSDVIEQYQITVSSGTAIDRCVHAGLVAAAQLQAKDQAKYSQWKATESADCAAAGINK